MSAIQNLALKTQVCFFVRLLFTHNSHLFPKMAEHNDLNTQHKATSLNLMTFNVRHDGHEHSAKSPFAAPPSKEEPFNPEHFKEEQPWTIRKWKVLDTILLYSPDVVALQVRI